ncbi:MAG: hypothetical protein JWR07_1238 [Nevskia sp.]|nr:hypothetical protein [Nevskia sp.]
MKLSIECRYPASAAVVLKMMTTREFHTGKLEILGLAPYTVLAHHFDGGDFSIKIRRKMAISAPVPAALRRFTPAEITVTHEDCWNVPNRSGAVDFEVKGLPVELSCRTALIDREEHSLLRYDWDIGAKVPLLGGALEKLLMADLERKLMAETQAGIGLLKDYL